MVEGVSMTSEDPQIVTIVDTARNLVLHRVVGPIDTQEIVDALLCIARSKLSLEETRILWDMREAAFDWNLSAVTWLSEAAQAVARSRGAPARFAVVVEKQLDFETARRLELVNGHAIPLRVFRDYDEGLQWVSVGSSPKVVS
jgi:hypothetical protein